MFARRHPFLFFFLVIFGCCTMAFLGIITLFTVSTSLVSRQIASQQFQEKGNIGIVEITGMILSSKKVIKDIQAFRENKNIKAIVLRIDSPGGGIGPSQEIYREILKTRKDKKVITSMGAVAASGGYYIAAASDGIVANPGTITGSIGVIMEYANLMEIAKKIGISPVVIKSGEFKDIGSPLRELKETEKKLLQDLVDELHSQFVHDTAAARKIQYNTMAALADGRVYTGQKAASLKLVDRLGNLDDAVLWAAQMAGIKEKPVPVYPKEDRITFLKRLADTLFKDINISGAMTDNLRYIIN